MKSNNVKILVAGVGGQGIIYLTNMIAEAALISNIPVKISEIHGLSQRGGTVTAGIGLGNHCTGFIGTANVDFLIGLEPLEVQRCLPHLHKNSRVVLSNYRIAPYSVNAETAKYPDVNATVEYLSKHCKEVVFVNEIPAEIAPVVHNVFLLGVATRTNHFPFPAPVIEQAIHNVVDDYHIDKTVSAFRKGINFLYNNETKKSKNKKKNV